MLAIISDGKTAGKESRLTFVDGVVLSLEKVCRWTLVGEIEDCEVELVVLRAAALRLSDRPELVPFWTSPTLAPHRLPKVVIPGLETSP